MRNFPGPWIFEPHFKSVGFVRLKAALDPILSSGQIWSFLIVESCSRQAAGPEGCLSSPELVWEREVNWCKGGFGLAAFVLSPKTMSRVTRRGTSWMAHGRLVPFPRSPKLFWRVWGCRSLRFCFELTYGWQKQESVSEESPPKAMIKLSSWPRPRTPARRTEHLCGKHWETKLQEENLH